MKMRLYFKLHYNEIYLVVFKQKHLIFNTRGRDLAL